MTSVPVLIPDFRVAQRSELAVVLLCLHEAGSSVGAGSAVVLLEDRVLQLATNVEDRTIMLETARRTL